MTRIQKVFCILLCACMLGTAALAVTGFFSLPDGEFPSARELWRLVPLYAYSQKVSLRERFIEDDWTCEQILKNDQNCLRSQVEEENRELVRHETQKEKEQEEKQETKAKETVLVPHPKLDLSPERLADFDYLMNNFFILDKGTAIGADQLNAETFLKADMTLHQDNSAPQILIYHSHSQEDFTDTVPGDVETTIVGVGNYLTTLLEDTYGYNVIHLTDTFDVVDGEIDRNRSYDFAREKVEQILEENPSIEVIIDLHRDGVDKERHLVTEIGGEPTAKLMLYNGLSYTVNNGPVDYLPNPHIQENLAFSFQLEMQGAKYYPDLFRGIYLAGLRYNLHLRPKAILLEAGAQTNSSDEVKNAMEPFADILNRVLSGES